MNERVQTDTVTVYVRLCEGPDGRKREDCRELSFSIPEKLSQKDILDAGFAIDGRSATESVTPYPSEGGVYVPLSEALLERQRYLVDWLAARGFDTQFK